MQPLFTIHAGEYLVGNYIEKKFGKYVNVWIPSKDTGIDLLLTNKDNSRTVSIQVKFSKDFVETTMSTEFRSSLLASGWWTLSKEKIEKSEADFWIFVQHSFKTKEVKFIIIKPAELLEIFENLERYGKTIHSFIWITNSENPKCWETRGLKKEEKYAIVDNTYSNNQRELTHYLENWKSILEKLEISH